MPTSKQKYFIIDFDSTLVQVESLDKLAELALAGKPDGKEIAAEIQAITKRGMEGEIPFSDSLARRMALLKADKTHVQAAAEYLKARITKSFARNKSFFSEHADAIYIISGGFRELIAPAAQKLGVADSHVLANTLVFDGKGNISGFDRLNPLAGDSGKAKCLKALGLKGEMDVIGDGVSDFEIKKAYPRAKFFAFTENVKRDAAVSKADYVIASFDEFLYINHLPMTVSYPKSRIKALLLENISPIAAAKLREEGYAVETMQGGLSEEELAEKIKDVSILGIRSRTPVTQAVLASARRLVAVGSFCIGTDNVDLGAALRKGVAAFNAPYSNTRSVAELVIGEIIVLLRRVAEKNAKMHSGCWDKSAANSHEIRGKKLGIIGYGNVGSQVSALAEALGMDVYYYDTAEKLGLGNAKNCASMDELLKIADIVTVHVDGRPQNAGLIGEPQFALMKDKCLFINVSRGATVDVPALAKNIKSGKIIGAAADVFPREPKDSKEEFVSELRGLPNVILTPHIGGSTKEAQDNIAAFVCNRLIEYVNSGNTMYSVNFPQVQLPPLVNSHRFLHVHKNVPGMLSKIDAILYKHKINIEGQYLLTSADPLKIRFFPSGRYWHLGVPLVKYRHVCTKKAQ